MSKQILFKVFLYIISTIFILNISDRAKCADFNNLALSDAKKDSILFLDTTLNTVSKGRLIVVWRGEDILVKYVDLKLMGLVRDRGQISIVDGETYISLKSLAPDLDFKVNDINFTLEINARTNLLTNRTVKSFSYNTPPADLIQGKDSSLFLNYAVNVNAAQNQRTDATIFTELGYSFDKSFLYSGFRYNEINGFQRGFTNLTIDDRDNLNRTMFGDSFINNSSNLGGNPTIGGLSFGRKFALNPYLVTSYQDFSLRGAVTTPSTVDIYNNGVFLRREQLSPGQYELRNLPLNTGNNNTTAIVRDSFGREQVINNLNYFSANILKPGLTDYNFNIGFRRQESNNNPNYQELLAVGNYRAGINEQVTAGLRAEGNNNLINIGGDLALKLPFGEIGIEGAVSNSNGASGTAGTLKYNYSTPGFGFNASTKILSPDYANTTLDSKQDRTTWDNNLQVVFPISSHNSLNLQYQNMQYRDLGTLNRISASTSFNLSPQQNLSLTLSHNSQSNGRTDNSVFVGFSLFDDRNNSVSSINYQNQNSQNSIIAQIDKPLGVSDGLGYRLQTRLADGQPLSTNGTLRGQTSFGRYEANYSQIGGDNSGYLNAAGGVLLIKNKTFFTRPLDNSYSLVELPGLANVPIRLNNNIVGKTGNDGSLILTGLQPYYASKIGVDRKDIPLDYSVGSSDKFVAPMERSGVVVTFPVRKLQSFLGKVLVRTLQQPVIPSYGQITVETNDGTVKSPLGTEAEFYLENLTTGKHSALIEYEGGECRFTIDIPKQDGLVVELGELTCSSDSAHPIP